MNGLTKLGTILTVVFVVSILALVAELLYVLWRRQPFRRRSHPLQATQSKEQLLYLFCWKNHSRIEPSSGNPHATVSEGAETVVMTVEDDDVAKWQQAVRGPSRVLFTIKEEEREGTETVSSEAEIETVKSRTVSIDQDDDESASMSEEEEVLVVRIVVEEAVVDDESTPFSTPCASPPYYTPSPSPTHDKYYYSPRNGEAETTTTTTLKGENDVSSVIV